MGSHYQRGGRCQSGMKWSKLGQNDHKKNQNDPIWMLRDKKKGRKMAQNNAKWPAMAQKSPKK